ncbi:MAG TPA: Bax inhibitor-1/YccA family protein [Jatrophihabitantaceae bacterium]|nr:Bax inhibitor-1/YccA family protein [Jatrophihabitantaceae bacterium]
MSNPVLTKLSERPVERTAPPVSPEELQRMYDRPSYQPPVPPGAAPPFDLKRYGGGRGDGSQPIRYMTLDDVVVRTGAMLAVIFIAGALTWSLGPTSTGSGGLIALGLIGGLALGLYMAFTMRATAVTSLAYSAFEGLLLGGVSRAFNDRYPGIVVQAVTGTMLVALGMLVVYRSGAIRVTPRFTRVVIGATIGAVALMFVNLLVSLFVHGGLGLRDAQDHVWLAVGFSALCIVIAAFNLVLDFDMIEQCIKRGVDERFAWFAAFGLMVTLIWLYIEMLRLIGYLRD